MMIVVLLGDESLLTTTIARAGQVIPQPHAGPRCDSAGAGQGYQRSTRSSGTGEPVHVRRMFERLEVNSQTALIRTLMSVDPPTP